ncbi:MAG: YigZ family protein [Ignavibacteriae bacterium]|nr:YigZ family protein [Ignavibacteriota bacterium]
METLSKEVDIYYTIDKAESAEIKILGSRFISHANNSSSKDIAMDFLQNIKEQYHDATHNCFAYKIGKDGLEFRAVDDGEPSGSAGKPILFSINKHKLSDVIVVVTRYFGGKKLGVGGLARAYSQAADEVLQKCNYKKINITTPVKIICTYEDLDIVKRILSSDSVSYEEKYHDVAEFVAHVSTSKSKLFIDNIISATRGRAGANLFNV